MCCLVFCYVHCFSPFPEVAESVQEELDKYRTQEDEVKHLKSIMVGTQRSCFLRRHSSMNMDCFCIGCYTAGILFFLKGLEGEDEGAISMLSDNTAKLTSAVRWDNEKCHSKKTNKKKKIDESINPYIISIKLSLLYRVRCSIQFM